MLSALVICRRFGRSTDGAVTIDFVALAAMVLIVAVGFSSPLVDGVMALADAIRAQLDLHPVHDPVTWN